jgi:hypothetical protein
VTGIVVVGEIAPADVYKVVRTRRLIPSLVRVVPLPAVKLTQIEVHNPADGLPAEDPELVAHFAAVAPSKKAVFVHVNHTAKQAIVHPMVAEGDAVKQLAGFVGEPGEVLDKKLVDELGVPLAAITAADDGTRIGIGVSSSATVALLGHERVLAVPRGMPTDLGSFAFHDGAAALSEQPSRLCFFAFDRAATLKTFADAPGHIHWDQIGPLAGRRAEIEQLIAAKEERALPVLEALALSEAAPFAVGDSVHFWDNRVLPLLHLASDEPVFDSSDIEDLEEAPLLEAMTEILPTRAPPGGEGSLLAFVGDDEVMPLAPWAQAGEDYAGSVFVLRADRLLAAVRAFEGQALAKSIEKFHRAWYRAARPGQPEGDAYVQWSRAKEDESREDTTRFFRDWAELRVVLEVAALNKLDVGLLFYEGGAKA